MQSKLILSFLFNTLLQSAAAQDNAGQLGVQAISQNFVNAGLTASLVPGFDPVAVLDVAYPSLPVLSPGQNLSTDQVKPTPSLWVQPANSSVQLGPLFTLAMVDADVVGTDDTQPITRHWLVNNVTLSQNTNLSFTASQNITAYAGPFPAVGSGSHRYVMLLYSQPDSFKPPSNLSSSQPVEKFNFQQYVQSTGLQGPVAGFYMQVEQGASAVSVSATSAVVTSTLPAAQSQSGSGSAAPAPTGAARPVTKSCLLLLLSLAALYCPLFYM